MARNGFVILVKMRDSGVTWAYHYPSDEEGKAKRAFAKLVADEFKEPVAITIEKFQSGAFSVKGMNNTFCAIVGNVKMSFFPTVDMGDYFATSGLKVEAT